MLGQDIGHGSRYRHHWAPIETGGQHGPPTALCGSYTGPGFRSRSHPARPEPPSTRRPSACLVGLGRSPVRSMCAAADAPSAKTPGVGTRIYSFGVGAEADRPDGCEAVREAIEQGATTWREVSAMTGISHEWARQLGARIGVKPAKPVESDRPESAKGVKAGPHRRKRKPQWNAPEVVDRFWSQVEQNGPYATGFDQPTRCWMWQGRTDAQNYGVLSVGRFRMSAHRYSYRLHLGRTPWSVVDHLCHSYSRDCRGGPLCPHRLCVNPEHLEVVTPGRMRGGHLGTGCIRLRLRKYFRGVDTDTVEPRRGAL